MPIDKCNHHYKYIHSVVHFQDIYIRTELCCCGNDIIIDWSVKSVMNAGST